MGQEGGVEVVDEAGCEDGCDDFEAAFAAFGFGIFGPVMVFVSYNLC